MHIPDANDSECHDDNWQPCRICERIPFWYGALMKVPVHQVAPLQPNIERLQTDKVSQSVISTPTQQWGLSRSGAKCVTTVHAERSVLNTGEVSDSTPAAYCSARHAAARIMQLWQSLSTWPH